KLLTNLIFNSVDAMPNGGTLAISAYVTDDNVLLQVGDTGTGMTEEIRQRCLEPFFTTKGEQGTGLGLAMVKNCVKRHEGRLDIKSLPGQGTTFVMTFPIFAMKKSENRATAPPI